MERENTKSKTEASTVAKLMFVSMLCSHRSINELVQTNAQKSTRFSSLFKKREYVPKMHGIRDCIVDTDCKQLETINQQVLQKTKENKIFAKNKVDGLTVVAWDGVELTETKKEITGLPEREHQDGEINKYIKYLCAMQVGERANVMVASKQMLEVEKVTSKTGKQKAKTIGETTAFDELWNTTEKTIGGVIDVHVFDALFLNQFVTNKIEEANRFFVIRMTDETRNIYKDAQGLFENREPDEEYEIVEIITHKKVKYSKAAKHKDYEKTKVKTEKRLGLISLKWKVIKRKSE